MVTFVLLQERRKMEETPNKSYSVVEVAEKLGCCRDHVYRMIKYGNLEAFRIGIGKSANIRISDKARKDFIERMTIRNQDLKHG